MTFEQLELIEPIRKALKKEKYTTPTPIQAEAIPVVLDGSDLLGCAQTGTGKTAAFSIPIIQKIEERISRGRKPGIKALILTPTRELAIQIGESFTAYGRYTHVKHTVIFGGVGQKPQTDVRGHSGGARGNARSLRSSSSGSCRRRLHLVSPVNLRRSLRTGPCYPGSA